MILAPSKVIKIRGGDEVDVVLLGRLDIDDLAGEYQEIGASVAYYGALRDEARNFKTMMETKQELVEARIQLQIREEHKSETPRMTDKAVDARVKIHPEFQEACRNLAVAELQVAQLGTVLAALNSKQEAMISASADRRSEQRTTL